MPRAVLRLAGLLGAGVVLGGTLSVAAIASPVRACSAAPIPFDSVRAHPGAIGLVRVTDIAGDPDAPDRYRLTVDEVWRGALAPVLEIEPPVVGACGDLLIAGRGERLMLALDVRAFDAAQPMAAYWAVRRGDD